MAESSDDPFAPVKSEILSDAPVGASGALSPIEDRTFQIVDERGIVVLCKMESGVPVKIKTLGPLKQQVRLAIYNAAMAPSGEKTAAEQAKMSHIELAAYHLARAASGGDLEGIDKLLDRLIGKPKQSTESVRLNFNVDEVLTSEDSPKQVQAMQEFEEMPDE